ncbi:unnamed protein product [Lepeophtheirus salmonis]|uniref:(salmon louse) hypothetical protein n=1 Tax=Lepeophtheirus salmonis TaxID=72036 RepID=A0A7R8CH89_LEPSM|nr:unnamed protein product [Lepeophtheirus salmonis]CAF2822479.1 unnamed protein product [Lepeophtheirus salmonis]
MLIIPLYLLLLHSTFVVSRSAFYFSNRSPYLRRSGSSGSNNYYVTPSPASTPTPPSPSPLLSNNIIYSFSPLDEETMKKDTTRDNRPFFYNTVTSPKLDLQDEDDLNKEESNALLFTSPKKMKNGSTAFIRDPLEVFYGVKFKMTMMRTRTNLGCMAKYLNINLRQKYMTQQTISTIYYRNQNEIPNYGNIRYYDAPSKSSPSSFMDKLRSKLRDDKGLPTLSSSSSNDDRSSNEFDGFITQEEPSITQSPRPFEKLRLQLLSGDKENDDDRMVAFDSIKNKLLNKSIKQRMIDQSSRGIRRKNSKKRRKNKRRRNRKNRRNGRHKTMRRMQDLRKSNEGVIKYEEE